MKIVHLSVVRELAPGIANQLGFEHSSAQKLHNVEWTTLALHNGPASGPFTKTIPHPFRALFLRNLYGWLVALRLSRTHDIVMMRHMAFDPFAFIFAPFLRNRVTVHHSKEIEELLLVRKGWKGRAASMLERHSGRISARNALAILGVTQEIAEYERDLHVSDKKIGVYSNGIDLDQVQLLPDERQLVDLELAFICGVFSEWHGLDKLIAAVDEHVSGPNDPKLTIHLIGSLSKKQEMEIAANEKRQSVFQPHGRLRSDAYRPVLAKCDAGIASVAMDRQNLNEGSTLKVREMLAMGLPVFSGHRDVALPTDKNYVRVVDKVTLPDLLAFAQSTKQISRDDIRNQSSALIDKKECMSRVVTLFEKA